ncbi:MAG: PAS domain-containing sensor histidine kinase [Alphaproteobacteria bacterium]|nr:PAS domain-containing sensor histidine kinase [Alphaproteobacteria bacterium]MBU0803174.1 PAS domain-containing sensor histidine kinase [Alphaproteobacteria bacterium]MBU0873862.1 PAS domain-containing sensor histidine kinase [Alphaproteobacteria bacterium]MBU1400638.1 PAS domain-containing sensor histidine kinase [Alphaproteobacteria bacterium]MBU1590511.1 PAS domain-containing sensor histidine kinase [Alphaproteobacteria bacterium]
MLGDIAAGCERLVHSSVTDSAERLRQRRFLGILIAGPVPVAVATALLLPTSLGATAMLGTIFATFGAAWLMALIVAMTGRVRLLEPASLILGAIALSVLVAGAGGLASPALLAIAALPIEAWWLQRTSRAALFGATAALAVIPAQAIAAHMMGVPADAGGTAWLALLVYAAFLAPRLAVWQDEVRSAAQSATTRPLEEMIDAVVLSMSTSGEVMDASPQARRILGVAPELLLANGLFDRIHVADRVAYMCALADLRGGDERRSVEAKLRIPGSGEGSVAPDFRPFLIDMMRQPGADQPILMVVRTHDEMVDLREELAATAETAKSLEIAKSRFLAAVSHELRTPLNAIIGFSDMLQHEMFGAFQDPRQKEYVGLISESGHHLLSVVNAILDVSRIEAGSYPTSSEPFEFAEAVTMCHAMLKDQARARDVELTLDVAREIGEIDTDRRAVKQILINLVSNAIKFTPGSGSVVIGANRVGSRVHFWVSDTGIGMAEEELAQIGKPFTQIQNDYTKRFEGAGLGLSLVSGLVSLLQGTMSIESEPGNGTTVTVTLPVEKASPLRSKEGAGVVTLPQSTVREEADATYRKRA